MLELILKSVRKSLLAVGFCAYAACGDTTIINNYNVEPEGGSSVQHDSSVKIQMDAGAKEDAPAYDADMGAMPKDMRANRYVPGDVRNDTGVDVIAHDVQNADRDVSGASRDVYTLDNAIADAAPDAAPTPDVRSDFSAPCFPVPCIFPDAPSDGSLYVDVVPDVRSVDTLGADVLTSLDALSSDARMDATRIDEGISTYGKIVFRSGRDGNYEIYSMNADGTEPVNLSNNTTYEGRPQWSPDGSKIAFVSNRWDGATRLYVMDNDGSNVVRLNNYGGTYTLGFSWSPDNFQIVSFTRFGGEDCGGNIFIANVDGSEETSVTGNSGDCSLENNPSWSPDGTKIAYEYQSSYSNREIYSMNADGRAQTNLTNDSAYNTNPQWSPEGSKIAFRRSVFGEDGTGDIYVMNSDGTEQVNVTNNYLYEGSFSWSPDSRSIAHELHSGVGEDIEIYTVNIEDLVNTRLTDSLGLDRQPRWSPDGSRIVFMSTQNGNAEIFTMDSTDGGNLRNLSNDITYNDSFPDWSL